jgi:hypothetical protein
MTLTLKAISSMATRQVLLEVAAAFEAQSGYRIEFESVGGVDAAKRVQAGEAFDAVVLASDAIDKLIAAGHVLPGRVDLVRSGVVVAVRAGAALPDIGSEDAVRAAVLGASSISSLIIDCHGHYTTAPKALENWRNRRSPASRTRRRCPKCSDLKISDDELRESIETNQLKLMKERGRDSRSSAPRASFMAHHIGDFNVSSPGLRSATSCATA